MRPWDAYWPDGPLPIETARKGWGRIAIANADSGAYAYAHSAIDQAARAVSELLGTPDGARHSPISPDRRATRSGCSKGQFPQPSLRGGEADEAIQGPRKRPLDCSPGSRPGSQ